MDKNDELYKAGLLLHGHKCPAMPMGLRAGLAALEALGVERALDGQLTALVEIDSDHCATCYADGVMMSTGCTFGKGNIRKLGYGKFVLTLIDNKSGRSVRVATRNEVIKRNQESEFIQFRKKGVPASKIDAGLVEPSIEYILAEPTEKLFKIDPVQEIKIIPGRAHDFNTIICSECGEVAVERYARIKNGKVVCIPCAEKA
ncbi:MAG: tRNA CCA-pyrophosphorylase [Leptolinea sp.]|jgi:formylmethanofuran dehydrogenase subunit E|nr:tRNA CCA-pyrophosphorylase [Leptolinea sp.]